MDTLEEEEGKLKAWVEDIRAIGDTPCVELSLAHEALNCSVGSGT